MTQKCFSPFWNWHKTIISKTQNYATFDFGGPIKPKRGLIGPMYYPVCGPMRYPVHRPICSIQRPRPVVHRTGLRAWFYEKLLMYILGTYRPSLDYLFSPFILFFFSQQVFHFYTILLFYIHLAYTYILHQCNCVYCQQNSKKNYKSTICCSRCKVAFHVPDCFTGCS